MTVRLTVDRAAWNDHVGATVAAFGGALVPVVKGNGYGFGRRALHEQIAAAHDTALGTTLGTTVCVGTVHELTDVPDGMTAVVLTPTLAPPAATWAVLTVGSTAHVAALAGWHGRVIVKLAGSMRRYGVTTDELPALLAAIAATGLAVHAHGLHLPLAGDDSTRRAEIEQWLPHLAPDTPLWVSHLSAASFAALSAAHPTRRFRVRVGTALWHGIPRGDFLHLSAEVLHTAPVRAGDTAGYFLTTVPADGTLLAIGAGSAHGVVPLVARDPDRRSPFHFARQRLQLLEPPHMHTSLVIVPGGQPCPRIGDRVDVQRPLTATAIDELEWV